MAVLREAKIKLKEPNAEEEEVIAEDYDNQKKDTISSNANDSEYGEEFMGNLEKKLMVWKNADHSKSYGMF